VPLEIEQFLHTERLPHMWCAGCGIGIVTGALLRAMVDLGLKREETVVVGGVGCSSRAAGYVDVGSMHTIHGRALAFATGIKLCILFNNQVYGMTGGQISPMADWGDRATTAPYGQVEEPFDLCRLTQAAGATFVARGIAADIRPMQDMIRQGIEHRGFSFIEAVVPCPMEYGKRNVTGGVLAMLDEEMACAVPVAEAAGLSCEQLAGKLVTGILHHETGRPEFQRSYAAVIERAKAEAAEQAEPAGADGEELQA
jgi:2-oxoglutarate ferredoxin oxidoreductase subunit beta